ncbi:hypothetical protein OPV22_005492 [Ensete ventricosum]|uniref:Uncharacterized protein n=1 Tax=Ensete ventricosum TaxID=4639 RepID=A0AAV8RIL4_ENSVE|nr:hypothetical protein OPV22_005492 [Ensete ventricosum]
MEEGIGPLEKPEDSPDDTLLQEVTVLKRPKTVVILRAKAVAANFKSNSTPVRRRHNVPTKLVEFVHPVQGIAGPSIFATMPAASFSYNLRKFRSTYLGGTGKGLENLMPQLIDCLNNHPDLTSAAAMQQMETSALDRPQNMTMMLQGLVVFHAANKKSSKVKDAIPLGRWTKLFSSMAFMDGV